MFENMRDATNEYTPMKIVGIIFLLCLIVISIGGIIGYAIYYNSDASSQENAVNDDKTESNEEEIDFSNKGSADTVEEAVNEIEEDLESLNLNEDFEDFDEELEFGIE